MRILMTTDTVGGVWTFTQELALGLLDAGCAVALVSLGGEPSREQRAWAERLAAQTEDFSFESSAVPLEWMQANDAAYAGAAPLLLRMARQFHAEVLHASQFCFGALPLNFPKVVTAHSDVLSWREACRDAPLEDSPWLRRYRALVSRGLQGADAVVAPTRWMLEAVGRHFALPAERSIIANGRELTPAPGSPRKLQGVTAGRLWDEAKGVAMLREVSSPMPLVIAGATHGDGAQAPAMPANVHLRGPLTQPQLMALFTESAVYLCTSLYEPFGLAPLEAALCGCAVLARDLPSQREVWGEGALYFRDAVSLSTLLQALHGDAARLEQAQARSRARAATFTRKAMAQAYLELFRTLRQSAAELADVA